MLLDAHTSGAIPDLLECEVAVVGAGTVGLLLATELARAGRDGQGSEQFPGVIDADHSNRVRSFLGRNDYAPALDAETQFYASNRPFQKNAERFGQWRRAVGAVVDGVSTAVVAGDVLGKGRRRAVSGI